MLNILWPIFLIVSFVFAFFCGRIEEVNNSIFESTKGAVELCFSLLGVICLWNGIMQILLEAGITKYISRFLKPVMKVLFPKLKKEDDEYKEITMNMMANIMGLGNAATPSGLKAMETMQRKNKNKKILSDNMAMFIIINTASIQIIPTTVIAIRNSLGSQNSTAMILPIWISTIIAFLAATISAKIFMKKL